MLIYVIIYFRETEFSRFWKYCEIKDELEEFCTCACTVLSRVARVVKGESAFHAEESFEEIDDVHHWAVSANRRCHVPCIRHENAFYGVSLYFYGSPHNRHCRLIVVSAWKRQVVTNLMNLIVICWLNNHFRKLRFYLPTSLGLGKHQTTWSYPA